MTDIDPERLSLEGRVGEIFKLVARGATDEQWAEWLRVPLEHAAADGDAGLFGALIEAGADGSAGWRGCHDRTLLHAAARGGNAEVISALLDAGAGPDVNVVLPSDERSALYLATSLGHEGAARRLLRAGAYLNFFDVRGNFRDPDDIQCDTLYKAIVNDCGELVSDLLNAGADPNRYATISCTPLHTAACCGFEGIVSTLLARGVNKDALDRDGESPLIRAAKTDHLAVVKCLVAASVNVEIRDCHGYTALAWAAELGHIGVLKAILGHGGCDVNAADDHGYAAIHRAAEGGQAGAIDALIEAGADIELKDSDGWTPLCLAACDTQCQATQFQAMRALLHHGANPRAQYDYTENTPLHLACNVQGATVEVAVDLLLRYGADETAMNNDGETPARLLAKRSRPGFSDFPEEMRRAQLLLARAPKDRAWRRRCWLVMLRSRNSRARTARGGSSVGVGGRGSVDEDGGYGKSRQFKRARGENAGGGKSAVVGQAGNGCAVGSGGEDGATGAVVASLIGMELEHVFRTVVGFL